MRNFVSVILVAALALSALAGAQNSAVLYWNMPTSPAQLAHGAGTLIMGDEPQGMSVNPAGLAAMKWRSVSTCGVQWWGGVYGGSVGAVLPVGKKLGVAGVSLSYWTLGAIAAYDDRGNPLGNISAQAVCGRLDYGYELFSGFSAGAGIKFFNLILPDRRDFGYAFDLGAEYRWRFLAANMQLRDLGPKYPVNNANRDKLPAIASTGARASLWKDRIVVGAQLNARTGERPYPTLGLDAAPIPLISARLGYSGEKNKDQMSRLGFGLGVHTTGKQDYDIEWGYRSFGNLGFVQSLTLGMNF
ncbi:MAG: hypothetical protein QME74_00775 [Candidatus Edwardsbacteria bacterium]|nr:hypothetical protein [Candidatus Edwardsbacteria bacterium]